MDKNGVLVNVYLYTTVCCAVKGQNCGVLDTNRLAIAGLSLYKKEV